MFFHKKGFRKTRINKKERFIKMSRLTVERFGRECEPVSFRQDKNRALVIEFTEECSGRVSLGGIVKEIDGRSVSFNLIGLSDGEYTPHLILDDMTVDLPPIRKTFGIISPAQQEPDFIGKLSARERRLEIRVEALEKRLEEITSKINGSIF